MGLKDKSSISDKLLQKFTINTTKYLIFVLYYVKMPILLSGYLNNMSVNDKKTG